MLAAATKVEKSETTVKHTSYILNVLDVHGCHGNSKNLSAVVSIHIYSSRTQTQDILAMKIFVCY